MPRDTLRIMYASNAPWCASGYGIQGRSLIPRLKALPEVEDVATFAWFGLQGGLIHSDGMSIYPMGLDHYGNDMYGAHCEHFKADLLITLIDAWVLQPDRWGMPSYTRWAPWYPVDHQPIPSAVANVVRKAHYPLTYAKFGREESDNVGIPNTYIPHGLETDVFKVLPNDVVADFRQRICEDAGWLGVMVSANKGWPSRKGFEEVLDAFKMLLPDLPKPARLYIHAEYTKAVAGGDLAALIKAHGLEDYVRFPNRYKLWIGGYGPDYLSLMYNAADVFLSPSKGEGFGIPIIEAQACGAPVVVTNFSSMPELVRWGIAVEPERLTWTNMDTWQAVPSVPGVADAMMKLTQERRALTQEQLDEKRRVTSAAIHQEYSWDTIAAQYWQPFMQRVLADINGQAEQVEDDNPA